MRDDDEREPWNAPWSRGHVPTAEERQEFADLWSRLFEELLKERSPAGRKRLLLMAWNMVFSTEEFRDWIEAEQEEWDSKETRAREAKNRRSRERRQRSKSKPH